MPNQARAIVDGHAHLYLKDGSAFRMIQMMNQFGISKSVVVAGGVVDRNQLAQGILKTRETVMPVNNRAIMQKCLPSDGRLLPFFMANPSLGVTEYRKIGRTFSGLKLAPALFGVPFEDARIAELMQVAKKFHHPVYLHCLPQEGFDVPDVILLAQQFPELNFILGHAGVGQCDFRAIDLIASLSNVFLETSGGFTSVIEMACRKLGPRRVIFGTEYPLQHPKAEIEKLHCLNLTPEDFDWVMGKAMMSLLPGAQNG